MRTNWKTKKLLFKRRFIKVTTLNWILRTASSKKENLNTQISFWKYSYFNITNFKNGKRAYFLCQSWFSGNIWFWSHVGFAISLGYGICFGFVIFYLVIWIVQKIRSKFWLEYLASFVFDVWILLELPFVFIWKLQGVITQLKYCDLSFILWK